MSAPVSRRQPAAQPGRPTGPDPDRWPDVASLPRCSRARAAVGEAITRRALARLPLRVRTPDGRVAGTEGPVLDLRRPGAFHRRIGAGGLIGFGEAYMARDWDAEDLVGVLTVLAGGLTTLVPPSLQRLRGLWAPRQPAGHRNTPEGAQGNIGRHYDLSNDLFALFLDETMTYSSALFDTVPPRWDTLPQAQHRKVDRLLDLAGVGPGTRMLEIGTGWGELALRAARRGAEVVTVTLSREQLALAEQRVRAAGMDDRVTVLLRDYRQVEGSYDAIVSVEMIEAVGEEFWPVYFRTMERLLAPGGRIALQAITMPDDRLLASRKTYTWIQKYIFPGGLLPSVEAVERTTAAHTGLRPAGRKAFGTHYAQTLRLWRERFTARAAEVDALGFDETFRRMWTFYLAYSEAGFLSRYLDVQQILLVGKEAAP